MNYPTDFTDDLRRKPICGVLSAAILAGVTFARATQAYKNNLMPWQKRHGGKVYFEQVSGVLNELGVQFRIHDNVSKQTLHRWVLENARPNVTYMVWTTKHVVTVCNGIAIDQYHKMPIADFGTRRCFVREVVEVL